MQCGSTVPRRCRERNAVCRQRGPTEQNPVPGGSDARSCSFRGSDYATCGRPRAACDPAALRFHSLDVTGRATRSAAAPSFEILRCRLCAEAPRWMHVQWAGSGLMSAGGFEPTSFERSTKSFEPEPTGLGSDAEGFDSSHLAYAWAAWWGAEGRRPWGENPCRRRLH
jgi:hypothetical protein